MQVRNSANTRTAAAVAECKQVISSNAGTPLEYMDNCKMKIMRAGAQDGGIKICGYLTELA
jgi:hypothetical protein